MNAKILLVAAAAFAFFGCTSCSEDYEEASSLHYYGENENPPLKGSDALNGNVSLTLKEGDAIKTVDVNDFKPEIEKAMGMTIDEVFAGLDNGTVRFHVVNPNRRIWDKTPANNGDNSWAISNQSSVTSPEEAAFYVTFDKAARTLTYELGPKAQSGSVGSVVVGFAKTDDSSYPVNVRIKANITVADLSLVEINGIIPAGDYNFYGIMLSDYAANIAFAFGVTDLKEFASWIDVENNKLELYMLDSESGNRYGSPDAYTANGMGYWCNANKETCSWGADGFTFFVEPDIYDWDVEDYRTDGGQINLGRAPGIESGTEVDASFVLVSKKDASKTLTFICHMVCE